MLKRFVNHETVIAVSALLLAGLTGWTIRDASATRETKRLAEQRKEDNRTRSLILSDNKELLRLTRKLHDQVLPKKYGDELSTY